MRFSHKFGVNLLLFSNAKYFFLCIYVSPVGEGSLTCVFYLPEQDLRF